MNAVVFDTLILSRKLAAAGMGTDQAQGVAAALAETLGEQIATRRDLEDVKRDLGEFRSDLKRDIQEVRKELQEVERRQDTHLREVEARLDARIREESGTLRAELRQSEQRQTIRLGLMLVGAVAVMGTLAKLL